MRQITEGAAARAIRENGAVCRYPKHFGLEGIRLRPDDEISTGCEQDVDISSAPFQTPTEGSWTQDDLRPGLVPSSDE